MTDDDVMRLIDSLNPIAARSVTVGQMRDRIVELEAKLAEMRRLLVPPGAFPLAWRIWGAEGRLLAALCRTGEISHAAAQAAAAGGDTPLNDASTRSHIAKLRNRVERHGIKIGTAHNAGYFLDETSLAIARANFSRVDDIES